METRTVKERILDELRGAHRTKDELLAQFEYGPQGRGAASLLAYLVKSGQVEIVDDRYRLTGRGPTKVERAPRHAPEPLGVAQPPEPELQWALWHDGDLLIRRGDVSVVLTSDERERIAAWLSKVPA